MAEFLLASKYGDSAFLGLRLKREGHRVRLFIEHPTCRDAYNGMIEKAKNPMPNRGEVILVDSEGMGHYADKMRQSGFTVIGGGRWSDTIELNRHAGIALMQQHGIRVPETKAFTSVNDGIRFLGAQSDEWFYKPSGNEDAAWTMGGSPDMVARFMRLHPAREFILQKKITGTEISLEGWFNGREFVYPFNSTVEDKKFLAGDLGPNVGCMGNVVWTYEDPRPRLAEATLLRLSTATRRARYVGPIDINLIIDHEGTAYGLEWTPRFGYDALQALSLLAPSNFGDQLIEFGRGALTKFDMRGEYAFVLNVSVPPYPHSENAMKAKGSPLDRTLLDHPELVMLRDVMLDNFKLPVIAGGSGIVGSFGNKGKYVNVLRSDVFSFVRSFKIPNAQYRIDCCDRVDSVISVLAKHLYDLPYMEPTEKPAPAWEIPTPEQFGEYIRTNNTRQGNQTSKPSSIPTTIVQPAIDIGAAPRFE